VSNCLMLRLGRRPSAGWPCNEDNPRVPVSAECSTASTYSYDTPAGNDRLHLLISEVSEVRPVEPELDALLRHLLRSALGYGLEQRETRHMRTNNWAGASF
jgi:hypothetical protein